MGVDLGLENALSKSIGFRPENLVLQTTPSGSGFTIGFPHKEQSASDPGGGRAMQSGSASSKLKADRSMSPYRNPAPSG
jgi:hypothetical protein